MSSSVKVVKLRVRPAGTRVKVVGFRLLATPDQPPPPPGDVSNVKVVKLRVLNTPVSSLQALVGTAVTGIFGDLVTLDASQSTGSPTGFTFTQVSGPAVTLSGSGNKRTYLMPAYLSPAGVPTDATVTFRVTVTNGVTTSSVVRTDTAKAWPHWQRGASGWIPRRRTSFL